MFLTIVDSRQVWAEFTDEQKAAAKSLGFVAGQFKCSKVLPQGHAKWR
jgi:hypothetical protein